MLAPSGMTFEYSTVLPFAIITPLSVCFLAAVLHQFKNTLICAFIPLPSSPPAEFYFLRVTGVACTLD